MDIQNITPEPLLEHYQALSPESQRTRFFTQPSHAHLAQHAALCERATVLALRKNTDITGVCEIHPLAQTTVEIALSVRDDHQGKGLGKTLLDAGLERAKTQGATNAILHFARSNTRMHAMVKKRRHSIALEDNTLTATIPL